jgi:hypothetical protein
MVRARFALFSAMFRCELTDGICGKSQFYKAFCYVPHSCADDVCLFPKLRVASSNLVARSNKIRDLNVKQTGTLTRFYNLRRTVLQILFVVRSRRSRSPPFEHGSRRQFFSG